MKPTTKPKSSSRYLIPGVILLALLATGGIFYWRRGLSEASAVEAGRAGAIRALQDRGILKANRAKTDVLAAREVKPGVREMDYEIEIDRAWAGDHVRAGKVVFPATGKVVVPLTVTIRHATVPEPFGLTRPVWVSQNARVRPSSQVPETLWAEVGKNPENVQLDLQLFQSDENIFCFRLILVASFIRLERYEIAALLLAQPGGWNPAHAWTPTWARRLQGEVKRLEAVLKMGALDPRRERMVRKGLDDFARSPALSDFRELYRTLVDQEVPATL